MIKQTVVFLLVAASCIPTAAAYNVLIIGGTRFSGAALWKELHDRGHTVTVYNRGKTMPKVVAPHRETEDELSARVAAAKFLAGDRADADAVSSLVNPSEYDYVFDMNARERSDVEPWVNVFKRNNGNRLKQYVFMSSAGVYLKSDELPHMERDPTDPKSRHKGKLDSEDLLQKSGLPWCSFRPTYICGPGNYNPVERYFFERVDCNRPVCIPGHGQHLTGLGHVYDLAVAMANVIDRTDKTTGKVYNVQNIQAITFDGVAKAAAKVSGQGSVEIVHYEPKEIDFGDKKAFPMRPQHFFTSPLEAMKDLDWTPKYDTVESIMRDAYENDFVHVKAAGKLKGDFSCDDLVLEHVGKAVVA
jgi:nucleoside-diphosphate-sugar epimerase